MADAWLPGCMVRNEQPTAELVCSAFGLTPEPGASITAVSRGATGRIWRLDLGTSHASRYAVKHLFAELDEASVRQETAFTAHLAAAGIRLPRSRPGRSGQFVVPLASPDADTDADTDADADGGGWLRLYEWIDGETADLADPRVAGQIGELLGRLHAQALPPKGPADPWYETAPPAAAFDQLADAGQAQGAAWGQELAEHACLLRDLAALVGPPARDQMVTCHRDLHPDNVLVDRSGALVPLDWDDTGPACPSQELAGLLLFWHGDDRGTADEAAVVRTLSAYYTAGGRGRLRDERSFGMYLAGRLNFLQGQASLALDPGISPADQEYASSEVSDTLIRLPSVSLIGRLLELGTEVVG